MAGFHSGRLHPDQVRPFNVAGNVLKQPGGRSAVHRTMVKGQRQGYHFPRGELAIKHSRSRVDTTNTQDGDLGYVQDRGESVNPKWPQVRK